MSNIASILGDALDRPAGERAAFVRRACDGDAALEAEVMSLVASHEDAAGFLDSPTADAMALGEMAETVEGTFGWLAHVLIEARSRWGAFEAALTSLVGETSRWLLELETTPDRAVESTAGLLETLDASPGLGPRSTAPLRILVTLHAIERTDDPADVEWAERVLRTALDDLADDPDHPAAALARAWLDRTRLDETRSAGDPR